MQGLGAGAQRAGAALLLIEHSTVDKRGCYGSLIQTGAIFGAVAGNGVFLILTALLAASGAACSVSLYILAMAVVTFVSVLTIRESFRRDLHETSGESQEKKEVVA